MKIRFDAIHYFIVPAGKRKMEGDETIKMIKMAKCVWIALALLMPASPGTADQRLTIIHTNDLHSHLLGAAPNMAYSPDTTGDDRTRGGFARIATIIKETRQKSAHPVLALDSGDFLMGSLFHMLSRERAYELRLLYQMGYDALTLGNHEFDLKPGGLARILRSAEKHGQLPAIVSSNLVFSPGSEEDDALEEAFKDGLIKPYHVLQKDGVRIGIFGLMGKDAAEVAPFASPVHFADPIESARKWLNILRENEKVDLVICLSHSGLDPDPDRSEDEFLAREVEGIDIIISGHTHTRMNQAIMVNDTIIVQAWEHGWEVGVLDIVIRNGGCVQIFVSELNRRQ
jgi:5'-nucleotidase